MFHLRSCFVRFLSRVKNRLRMKSLQGSTPPFRPTQAALVSKPTPTKPASTNPTTNMTHRSFLRCCTRYRSAPLLKCRCWRGRTTLLRSFEAMWLLGWSWSRTSSRTCSWSSLVSLPRAQKLICASLSLLVLLRISRLLVSRRCCECLFELCSVRVGIVCRFGELSCAGDGLLSSA